jgi:two-component system, OmpR family, phosphate regulon sensor histidine kinase PhoR
MKKNVQKSPFAKIILTFVIALLVPILSYTLFQFSQKNKDEEVIRSIYERQLDGILFSVNQYGYDQFHQEMLTLTNIANTSQSDEIRSELENFNEMRVSVAGSFILTGEQNYELAWKKASRTAKSQYTSIENLSKVVASASPQLMIAMRRAQKEEYIKPYIIPWQSNDARPIDLVLFPLVKKYGKETTTLLAGIFIDVRTYVNEVIARKFNQMNEGNFFFAVRNKNTGQILYPLIPVTVTEFEKSSEVWMIPELELLVKLSGKTLSDVSSNRTRTNLLFLTFVNVMIVLGLLYVLKNISKEMALAKLKTDFVANVSHELRTPLALIRMYAETLEMGRVRSEDKKHHYYTTIMNETTRLTTLINNILDFSKIESRKKEYRLVPGQLCLLVNQTLDMYQHHLERHGFKFELDAPPSTAPVNMDGEAVTQALLNLLDNAVKYSPDEKFLKIIIKETNKAVILSVQDHGMGIPESEHQKIFEKFYRVGNSLVHNTKGSGLGLNLVKHIMDIHNGQVTVQSQPGQGSTFSLVFPLAGKI